MRKVVLLTLLLLVFIVILHTTKGDYDTEEDPFYNMVFRKATKGKQSSVKGQKAKGSSKKTTTTKRPTSKSKSTSNKNNRSTKKSSKTSRPKNPSRGTTKTTRKPTKTTGKPTKTTGKPTKTSPRKDKSTSNKKDPSKTTTIRHIFNAMFPPLKNYQVNAEPAPEDKYPWIARVVHSRIRDTPYMCTAICIEKAIFITAARCILTIKAAYASVIYKGRRIPVKAFLTPSIPTLQSYEDIGVIVVDAKGLNIKWDTIDIQLKGVKRKDTKFQWFSDLNLSKETNENKFKVVGFATKKYYYKILTPNKPDYTLSELDVKVSREFCAKILYKVNVRGFEVPCYMGCTLKQYMENLNQGTSKKKKHQICLNYLGVEGAAVVNVNTNKLLGVATWGVTKDQGSQSSQFDAPVGFSVPNSKNFISDYACAKKIRDAPEQTDSYQNLCN